MVFNINKWLPRVLGLALLFLHANAYGWGPRGHALITRVAVGLLDQSGPQELAKPFKDREFMLAYLSNVPDIIWRNSGKKIAQKNAPTHYISSEYVRSVGKVGNLPSTPRNFLKALKSFCKKNEDQCPAQNGAVLNIDLVGTVSLRIVQLYGQLVDQMRQVRKASDHRRINDVLKTAGILSHFVGDVANPYHTTYDYDGWQTQQGGIHSYFESQVVDAMELTLLGEVFSKAQGIRDRRSVAKKTKGKSPKISQMVNDYINDSYKYLNTVQLIDRKFALLTPSKIEKGLKIEAKRRAPEDVKNRFRKIIVSRLAHGAKFLKVLWLRAWQDAGSPPMNEYKSFYFPARPRFVNIDY